MTGLARGVALRQKSHVLRHIDRALGIPAFEESRDVRRIIDAGESQRLSAEYRLEGGFQRRPDDGSNGSWFGSPAREEDLQSVSKLECNKDSARDWRTITSVHAARSVTGAASASRRLSATTVIKEGSMVELLDLLHLRAFLYPELNSMHARVQTI
jgi:hypothetical protein